MIPEIFQFDFNPFFILFILLAIVNSFLFFIIASRGVNSISTFWLLSFLVAGIMISVSTSFSLISRTKAAYDFWNPCGMMGFALLPLALYKFSYYFTGKETIGYIRKLLMFLPLVIILPVLLDTGWIWDLSFEQAVITPWGLVRANGKYSLAYCAYFLFYLMPAIFYFLQNFSKSNDTQKFNASMLLAFFMLVPITGGILIEGVFTYFIGKPIFPISYPLYGFMNLFVAYLITKENLFFSNISDISKDLIKIIPSALAVLDTNNYIVMANDYLIQNYGYSRKEIIGSNIKDLLPKDKFDLFDSKVLKTLDTSDKAEALSGMSIRMKNKKLISVSVHGTAVRDKLGNIVNYLIVFNDISKLEEKSVKLEEALTELSRGKEEVEYIVQERTRDLEEERFILESSIKCFPLGFILFSYSDSLHINRPAIEMLNIRQSKPGKKDIVCALKPFIDLEQEERQCNIGQATFKVLEDVKHNGRYLTFYFSPIQVQKKCLGMIVLIQDITESLMLEKKKDELIAVTSHELRTPLTAIMGNASLIFKYFKKNFKNKDLAEMVQDIFLSSERLIRIVNDFLDASSLEQNMLSLKAEKLDLYSISQHVRQELKSIADSKSLYIKVIKMKAKLPAILGDESRVRQILTNLVGNSLKYTEKGGVTIEIKQEEEFMKIYINDTGVGIGVKEQKNLFTKFQQAGEKTLTRRTDAGTGMGLYITKLLAEAMHGTVALESTKLGKGTSFSVSFPIAAQNININKPINAELKKRGAQPWQQ